MIFQAHNPILHLSFISYFRITQRACLNDSWVNVKWLNTHTDTQKMVRYKDWKEQKVGLEKALRTIAQSHFLKMSRNCGSLESLVCLLTEF